MGDATADFEFRSDEEFACIVLSRAEILRTADLEPLVEIADGWWISQKLPFNLDPLWREQLGAVASDRIEQFANFVIIADAVADASRERFREGVRSRKLTIANGSGDAHCAHFVLENWGLNESPAPELS
jgi:hypothetical protein